MRNSLTALPQLCALGAASPVMAEIHALVVGIDEYDQPPRLYGAVADAQDVEASLRRFGAQDVTLLTNRAASKAAIESAWREIVARTAPGDALVFAFAGHGSHEPDQNGDEAQMIPGDTQDENFILSGWRSSNPLERIVDDEIDLWFAMALEKGAKALFVADSCHSGTVHRGGGVGRSAPSVAQYLNEGTPDLAAMTPPAALAPPSGSRGPVPVRPGLFFVSAAEQSATVTEVTINGRKRGALSYAFARALDGAADYNTDGTLDHMELGHYLETVSVAQDDGARREFWPTLRPCEPLCGGDRAVSGRGGDAALGRAGGERS